MSFVDKVYMAVNKLWNKKNDNLRTKYIHSIERKHVFIWYFINVNKISEYDYRANRFFADESWEGIVSGWIYYIVCAFDLALLTWPYY